MNTDMEQYKELFIEEAKEHLQIINQSLLDFEKNPNDVETLNKIFRSAHTLKGSSGMMGFKDISELTHVMEDIFDNLRNGTKASSDLIDVLLECVDVLETRLNELENGKDEPVDVSSLIKKLKACTFTEKTQKAKVKKSDEQRREKAPSIKVEEYGEKLENEEKIFVVHVKLSEECVFKGARAFMVLNDLEKIGKIIKSTPSKDELERGDFDAYEFDVIVATKCKKEKVKKCIEDVSEVVHAEVKESYKEPPERKVEDKKPLSVNKNEIALQSIRTIKVHTEQLDKLMNLVGELVINKIQLLKIASEYKLETLKHTLDNIDRLTMELQDVVMRIRMVPVELIFNRFPRLVRDLSRKEGKKVNFIVEGKEIEVDRTILEEISEPLIHLLRNAVDHGIEKPEIRRKKGKNPEGTVKLIAERKRDHVVIRVEDDGAGIDPEKIRKAAVEKGIISKSEAEKLEKDQLIDMIFLPGLSTSEKVTETSGRGVGMDVVKTKIESFGGNVQIESEIGKGTKITLTLPLSLAIVKAMLIKVANQLYAIPVSLVSEVTSVKKENVRKIGNIDATKFREKVIPIVQLRELLSLPLSQNDILTTLIINREPVNFGLIVDSVVGLQEIVTKSLYESLRKIEGIGGVTILGDGRVVLILDPIALLSQKNKRKRQIEALIT